MAEVLPNAPLVEVVFELRWQLPSSGTKELVPPLMRTDPGYPILRDEFARAVKRLGFRHTKNMNPPALTPGHSIDQRYYKSEAQTFPLVQIGPGIFATNESAGYDWKKFKPTCLKHLRILIDSYPRTASLRMVPSLIELRYINVFPAESDTGKIRDMFAFLEADTNLGISRPSLLDGFGPLRSLSGGRLIAEYELVKSKGTVFTFDFGSGKSDSKDIVRMESKVRSIENGVPSFKTQPRFLKDVGEWLERAHSVTSPFFEKLIKPELWSRFQ